VNNTKDRTKIILIGNQFYIDRGAHRKFSLGTAVLTTW